MRKLLLFLATSVQGGTQGVRLSELLLEIGEDKIRELVAGNRRVAPNGEARFQLGHTLAKLVLRRSELRRGRLRGDERDAALAAHSEACRAAFADREDPDGAYAARWGLLGAERDAARAAHGEAVVLARGQTPRDRGYGRSITGKSPSRLGNTTVITGNPDYPGNYR